MIGDTSDIIVTGKPLPRLSASPECLLALKGRETGGVWDRNRLKLLNHGTPALAAYPDSGGTWTIGWGATGPGIHLGVRWTVLECEVRFESDVLTREASLRAMLRGSSCTLKQFEALLMLGFNIGMEEGGLLTSTLLKLHKAGNYPAAADEFPRWDKINGKDSSGLYERRMAERAVYLGGSW